MITVTIDCPHCEEPIECEYEHGHEEQYGSPQSSNPWRRPFVTGCLPDGTFAHVFTE